MMRWPAEPFGFIYLASLFIITVIRSGNIAVIRSGLTFSLDTVLLTLMFISMGIIPILFIFSPLLDVFNYRLPFYFGIPGTLLIIFSQLILYKAHSDLGKNWSITPQILKNQHLVTEGIYKYLRHPMYASYWLWSLSQPLLLENWVAGFATLAVYAPLYYYRVHREERLMIEEFDGAYEMYMKKTNRLWPKIKTG